MTSGSEADLERWLKESVLEVLTTPHCTAGEAETAHLAWEMRVI